MPDLTVASSQTDGDIAKNNAASRVDWASRELMANLLRMSCGGGKGHKLTEQMVDLLKAMQDYWDAHKRWPFEEISEFIAFDRFEPGRDYDREDAQARFWAEERRALLSVERGSMRRVAAHLLDQRTHISTSENEIFAGFRTYEDAHVELRAAEGSRKRTRKSGK